METKGRVILSPVHKVMQYDLGQWRISSMKPQAQELLEWMEVIATLYLPIYLDEGSGAGVLAVIIDGTVAKKDVTDTQQGFHGASPPMTPSPLCGLSAEITM